jgi:hypothetical protein
MKMSTLDRLFLLGAVLLAAWQIVVGIDRLSRESILAYTVAFGVLLVAALMLIILGFEALDSPVVVIVATIIPLSLGLGLIWDHLPSFRLAFALFAGLGLLAVALTRYLQVAPLTQTVVLTSVHGIAGLTIFLLPLYAAMSGQSQPAFALVGLGGGLIGSAGLLLLSLRAGRPLLRRETILHLFPGLLLLMTACFAAGFLWG